MRRVRVTAYPRIHVGLLDAGEATQRLFGGAGFALGFPGVQLTAHEGKASESDYGGVEDRRVETQLLDTLKRAEQRWSTPETVIRVESLVPHHIGLGCTTALLLSALVGTNKLYDIDASTSELQLLTKRAGTSGIGIHSFFLGGFVVDAGHPRVKNQRLLPSSARAGLGIPPLVTRIEFPSDWTVHVMLPAQAKRRAGHEEVQFFEQNTPVPEREVLASIAHVYQGLIPALLERDFDVFRQSVHAINGMGFKAREIAGQPAGVGELIDGLADHPNVAAGMSSMGPVVYAVTPSLEGQGQQHIASTADACAAEMMFAGRARNSGYEVETEANAD